MLHMNDLRRKKLIDLMGNWKSSSESEIRCLVNEILGHDYFAWEFGPDPMDDDISVLSISLERSAGEVTQLASDLGLPIQGNGWRVQVGMPPRDWDRYFEYEGRSGISYRIEGSHWLYELIPEDNDKVRVELFPDIAIEPKDGDEISRILLIGEIGERNLAEKICNVSIGNSRKPGTKAIENLRSEFAELYPDCAYREFLKS